jgi:glycosyltransferase involved in cell wall biosynthesis
VLKISIITIVFNDAIGLEKTIKSVINQTYDNVEYIIIDGGSTDGTLDIIKKYESEVTYWVSEPDEGVYDAMNKGIDLVTGQWINFMNAGDIFYSNEVVKEIFDNQQYQAKIIYGDHVNDRNSYLEKVPAKSVDNLWKGMVFCHQSAFIDAQYHKKHKYSLQYSIAGDFDFFCNAFKNKARFQHIDKTVSIFLMGGLSSVQNYRATMQSIRVINSHSNSLKHRLYYSTRFYLIIVLRKMRLFTLIEYIYLFMKKSERLKKYKTL